MPIQPPPHLLAGAHRPRPGRFRRAVVALGVITSVAPSMLSACEDETYSAPCAIIVDGSSSGVLFKAEKSLDTSVEDFLTGQRCGQVAFVPLNGRGEGSTCSEPTLTLDPGVGDPEVEVPLMREEALKIAHRQLRCAAKEYDGSDVLGAFRLATRLRPPGKGTYSWLVVSDMIHTEKGVDLSKADLSTPQSRQALITSMRPRIPGMTGLRLFPTDLGEGISNPTLSVNFLSFWRELLASPIAGNPTLDERHGA